MKFLITGICFLTVFTGFSQTDAFRNSQFNLESGIAVKGYDPVTYFSTNKAVKGKKEFAYSFHGVDYHFATAADRDLFQANPSKYEPQYGGWCAYAMGHDGSKVEIDPETFKIINGKLFLFYNRYFNNTLKSWNADESKLHAQADLNWQKYVKQ